MSLVNEFVAACNKRRGQEVSLRSVFPGRGAVPTKKRKEILQAFRSNRGEPIDGVGFDPKRGVFWTAHPSRIE